MKKNRGDLSRFTEPTSFAGEGADQDFPYVDKNDPDYPLKIALLVGATVTFNGVEKTIEDFDWD
tara:strand:+ start:556 stop:747 length:192 start_codon:yes stop_codon:yes gene_type:complete